jgi:hypothetical protein
MKIVKIRQKARAEMKSNERVRVYQAKHRLVIRALQDPKSKNYKRWLPVVPQPNA